MSQQLLVWAQKHMKTVEEGMPAARKIILTGEGQTFEQWCPVIGLEPGEWVTEVQTLLAALCEELPKKRVQLAFTAEDANGAPLGQCLLTVTGKNASIQDLGTQGGAKALADALGAVSKTMADVLKQARDMMEFQAQQLNKQAEQLNKAVDQNQEYADLFQALQKVELETGQQESVASAVLLEQVKEATPLVMHLVQRWMENAGAAGKSMGGAAAAAATNGKVATS